MQQMIDRESFRKWLKEKYYQLKEITRNTTVSDAFFIFSHNLGITFEQILSGEKDIQDYKEAVHAFLLKEGKTPNTRPAGYTAHLKYLIEYAKENGMTEVIIKTKKIKNSNSRLKTSSSKKIFSINGRDLEESSSAVKNNKVYGDEGRTIDEIFKMFPKNISREEVICKICVIDVTHSTHVGIHKKKFSVVDLANQIMSIKNIDERISRGNLSLINEIADMKTNLLSFASKYVACHNQSIYGRDDFYKYDSIVSKVIGYRGRDYHQYHAVLDEIIKKNKLEFVPGFRKKLDHFFWYNNK